MPLKALLGISIARACGHVRELTVLAEVVGQHLVGDLLRDARDLPGHARKTATTKRVQTRLSAPS